MSPMGDSAGRSARHRTGEGAVRRNTPRERHLVDPPFAPRAIDQPGTTWASAAILGVLIAVCIAPLILVLLQEL